MIYLKIPIISPGAYFWSKGLFAGFFLGGLIFGGGLIHGRIFTFCKRFFFVQATVIFLRFSAHNLFLLLSFFTFLFFNNVLTTVNTTLYS